MNTVFTLNTKHFKQCTTHFTLHSMHCQFCTFLPPCNSHSVQRHREGGRGRYTTSCALHYCTVHCSVVKDSLCSAVAYIAILYVYCTMHTSHFIIHVKYFTLHTVNFTLHTAPCTLHTADCRLKTAHWILHTAHCTLHTCTMHTAHCTLHIAHCTLFHPAQFALYPPCVRSATQDLVSWPSFILNCQLLSLTTAVIPH